MLSIQNFVSLLTLVPYARTESTITQAKDMGTWGQETSSKIDN